MTVSYTQDVTTCRGFGCFWKLLFRWRGSIYKLVWPDLIIYSILYASCSIVYRVLLTPDQKRVFEGIAIHCAQFTDLIPVAFVLGFYVSIVIKRWWEQYQTMPWPDALALFVSTCIVGQNERSRLMRRTIMRYVNLSYVITLSMICPRVKKRFPTLEHVMEAGFMTSSEKKIFEDLNNKTSHPKYWMPLVWAGTIVAHARKEKRIRDDFAVKTIIDEIAKYRGLCGGLLGYDWISVPLVYTQVVTLAVYTFFLGTIMGRQFLDPEQNLKDRSVDLYVPVFTFLQFFFYMGWLKVAETLVNPFGEDDDDFEVNWLIDRNLQVSYLIVDEMHEEHPDLIPDMYWDVFPHELPYTVATEHFRRMAPQGSTFNMEITEQDQEFLMPVLEEEVSDASGAGDTKINMNTSYTSLHSTGSGIAMRPLKPVNRNPSITRNASFMSTFWQKIAPGKESRLNLASGSTVRKMPRNQSQMSSVSNARSRESLTRNPTNTSLHNRNRRRSNSARHDSGSGPESSRQLTIPKDEWMSPNTIKDISIDQDGTIVIKLRPKVSSMGAPSPTPDTQRDDHPLASKAPRSPSIKPKEPPFSSKTKKTVNKATYGRLHSQELGSDDEANEDWSSASGSDLEEDKKAHSGNTGEAGKKGRKFIPLNSLPEDEDSLLERSSVVSEEFTSKGSATPQIVPSSTPATLPPDPLPPLAEGDIEVTLDESPLGALKASEPGLPPPIIPVSATPRVDGGALKRTPSGPSLDKAGDIDVLPSAVRSRSEGSRLHRQSLVVIEPEDSTAETEDSIQKSC